MKTDLSKAKTKAFVNKRAAQRLEKFLQAVNEDKAQYLEEEAPEELEVPEAPKAKRGKPKGKP